MSSSTTAPQQERSREAAGTNRNKQERRMIAKTQQQEGGKKKAKGTRSGMKERAAVQEDRGRNEGSHTRNAAGIKQGYGRNAANTIGGRYIQQGERSMKSAGLRNRNAAKTTGGRSMNPAGNHTIRNSAEL